MDLLTSEKSISRRPIYAPNSVVLVPLIAPTVQRRFNSKWAALSVCLIASFAGGFGASSLLRPRNLPQEIRTQVTDFHIVIPDGQTIVTVFNPQTERHIAARARLSADDAVFFRRELAGVVLATDSPWQRANKIRSWLVNGP